MSTYSSLRKIIPADQALANKGIQAGLEQVTNIKDTTLPQFSAAVIDLESNVNLNQINALTEPLPANVIAFYTNTLAQGSGPDGTLLLTDVIGSIAGWNMTTQFSNTASVLNSMTSQGDFNTLTNGSTGVYTVMETTISGAYTSEDIMNPGDWYTVIPGGLPGAGTYGPANSANASIQSAFTGGLTPAFQSLVGVIVASNTDQVTICNNNWNTICDQLQLEKNNLAVADVVFANLQPNLTPWGLVNSLSAYGLDTVEGGAAYVMESVANLASQGGQAIISTMREARNQARLSDAGLVTDILVSDVVPEPQADLGTSQYTPAQAAAQKIT